MGYIDESLAVVSYLAKQVGQNGRLGKKATQKLIHIIERIGKVPLKYNFDLYTYGPFSRELAGDLDILDGIQAIKIVYNDDKNGYDIQEGSKADQIIGMYPEFFNKHQKDIDAIVNKFGSRLAKELELTSTLLFIIDRKIVNDVNDDSLVMKKFSEIKPQYKEDDIRAGLKELRKVFN